MKRLLAGGSHGLLHGSLDVQTGTSELVSGGVLLLQLLEGLGDFTFNLGLGSSLESRSHLRCGQGHLTLVELVLELGSGFVLGGEVLVGLLELLGILDHLVDLGTGQSTDGVLDSDLGLSAGCSVLGGDLQQTVGVNLEGADKLGLTSGHGGNTGKFEFTQKPVVLALGSFTFVDGEGDSGLVVVNGGEDSRLVGRNGGVSGQDNTENVTLHGNTERQGSNIEQQQVGGLVRGLTGQNGGLNGGTVCDGLIGVDRLVELSAIEELGDERLNLGDTGGTTDEDDVLNLGGGDLGVLQDLLDGVNGRLEGGSVDLLESGSGDVGGEVNTVEQGVDFNSGLGDRGQGSLGSFTGGSQSSESSGILGDVQLVLSLELGLEVLQQVVVEVLTTQVGVTGGGLDGEDTALDGQEGNIESTTSQIEDQDNLLLGGLLVKTVGDGSSGGLVDDSENVQTSNGTGVLGGQSLGVVEVGGNGDNGLLDSLADLGLRDLLHLGQDHGGDFLRRELLPLTEVVNLDEGSSVSVNNGEGPVLHVGLDIRVVESSTDQSLGVENGVSGVLRGGYEMDDGKG